MLLAEFFSADKSVYEAEYDDDAMREHTNKKLLREREEFVEINEITP